MHSVSISVVMWINCLKTVIDYLCVTGSGKIMYDGHVLCLINDNGL